MVCATSSHILKFIFIGFILFSLFLISTTGTKHSTQPMLWKNVNSFFALQLHFSLCVSNLCPHFHFTLSIAEKWSQHIDLTELNRHILCSMHEERITMKKEKNTTTSHDLKMLSKKKCKSFVKWPKLGKLFTHNIRLLEWL